MVIEQLPTSENLVILVDYENEFIVVDVRDGESPQRIGYHEITETVTADTLLTWDRVVYEGKVILEKWITLDGKPYRRGEKYWIGFATLDNRHQITICAFGKPQPGLLPDDLHEMATAVYESLQM